MPGADPDLVKPLAMHLKKQGVGVHLKTKVIFLVDHHADLLARIDADAAGGPTVSAQRESTSGFEVYNLPVPAVHSDYPLAAL